VLGLLIIFSPNISYFCAEKTKTHILVEYKWQLVERLMDDGLLHHDTRSFQRLNIAELEGDDSCRPLPGFAFVVHIALQPTPLLFPATMPRWRGDGFFSIA
jgi:hypothetical protein